MRLFYKAGLPNAITQTDPVAAWPANGDPVFGVGYTEIIPQNDPEYIVTGSGNQEFAFEKFQLPASTNDNMTLGVMFYTTGSLNQAATADIFNIDDISLTNTEFAIATQPQTFDEVMRDCEFYFEKSYAAGVVPSTNPVTVVGERSAPMRISYVDGNLYLSSFELIYNSVKRAAPTLKFWSPDGTANNLQAHLYFNGADAAGSPVNEGNAQWTETGKSAQSVFMRCVTSSTSIINGSGVAGNEGLITYQYTADARLGV